MRDYFFLMLLPVLLYAMVRRPFIALGMWLWTSLFFPNAWMYGAGSIIRYNLLFAAVAILGYLAMQNKPKVELGRIGGLVLVFFFWTTLTTIFTTGLPEVSWDIWNRFLKITLLFLFILFIVEKQLHIDFILWCVVFSVGFYASVEALKFIASGGGHKIAGLRGHVLGDRNELACAFVMTLPIAFYLLREYGARNKWLRLALLGLMSMLVISIIGTQSRGGLIALLGLAAYLFLKSDNKVSVAVLAIFLVAMLSNLVSQEWQSRMDTIGAADEDASFMGRVVAWKLSLLLALEHPILGGGFKALEYFPNWLRLSEQFHSLDFFYTGDAFPDPFHSHAAHSVYFQVLGDHGFVGLALYLGILVTAFRTARSVARDARALGAADWIPRLATMLQLSIFSFALGGAALSFAYFDLIFAIYALILVLRSRILPNQARALKAPA